VGTDLLDGMLILQIGCFLLLLAAWPVYEYLKLRRRVRLAEECAQRVEQEYQHRFAALDVVQRQALERSLAHPQPLASPPLGFAPTLRAVSEFHSDDPYAIPIGWQNSDGVADLVTGSLYGESPYFVGNIQVTAMTRWGKNLWEFLVSTTLLYRTTPAQLRLFQIDGKGPDGALWRGLAHNWREPITREEELPAAIAALEALRAERMRLLEQHAVTKWEELPAAQRPPLVWVVINELSLLEKVLGRELESWLTRELSSALAGGIRYCILMQDASNWDTGWRRQIGLAVAGAQVSRDADKPNLGMATAEIKERGGIPPSELSERGQFTVRFYRDVASVSIPFLSVEQRKEAIARLPRALAAAAPSRISPPHQGATVPGTAIPAPSAMGQNDSAATLAALLAEDSIGSTAHQNGVLADTADTAGTAIDAALEPGDELTDEQITYLHLQRQWSPTRIAESRGVRGRKQARLERVYAVLGLRREPVEV
jgi:hypothetical protein